MPRHDRLTGDLDLRGRNQVPADSLAFRDPLAHGRAVSLAETARLGAVNRLTLPVVMDGPEEGRERMLPDRLRPSESRVPSNREKMSVDQLPQLIPVGEKWQQAQPGRSASSHRPHQVRRASRRAPNHAQYRAGDAVPVGSGTHSRYRS